MSLADADGQGYLAAVAAAYDASPEHQDFVYRRGARRIEFELLLERVLGRLKPNSRVIDLGCGAGTLARELARSGHFVELVDISARSLLFARQMAVKAQIVDMLEFTYKSADDLSVMKNAPFDAVLACGLFGHVRGGKHARQVLSQCGRVLKADGLLFATVPNPWTLILELWEGGEFDLVGRLASAVDETGNCVIPSDATSLSTWACSPAAFSAIADAEGFQIVETFASQFSNTATKGDRRKTVCSEQAARVLGALSVNTSVIASSRMVGFEFARLSRKLA